MSILIPKDHIRTTTYTYTGGFMLDVVTNTAKNEVEAWIYHKDYCVKHLMFGTTISDDFMEIVAANIDEYIAGYISDVMDEDTSFALDTSNSI